jgi:hypothetical protein
VLHYPNMPLWLVGVSVIFFFGVVAFTRSLLFFNSMAHGSFFSFINRRLFSLWRSCFFGVWSVSGLDGFYCIPEKKSEKSV